jgi:hypothetical protein
MTLMRMWAMVVGGGDGGLGKVGSKMGMVEGVEEDMDTHSEEFSEIYEEPRRFRDQKYVLSPIPILFTHPFKHAQ